MNKISCSVILCVFLMLSGCHATEKGYKSAYDAALNKRQQTSADIALENSIDGFKHEDGPAKQKVGDKEVFVIHENLAPIEAGIEIPGEYNIAVASFSMPTNCVALVSTLKDKGYPAFAAKNKDEKFYVIVSSFTTLGEAADYIAEYSKSNPEASYIGLPSAPIVINSNNRIYW